MDCTRFIAGYSDYDDSLLAPAEEVAFRAHLEACAACGRYDRVLRKGRMVARQLGPEVSRDFLPRLEHRILTASWPSPGPVSPAVAGGFLTLMVAAVAGLWLSGGAGPVAGPERPLVLPAEARIGPADWTAGRVARQVASSYSPLVIGPPAYRADRSVSTAMTSTTRSVLD